MKRQVFFSFEYMKDGWRAGQIRNMGAVSNNLIFSDNSWEEVRLKSHAGISKWIDDELNMRSCLILLIGSTTADRKWIDYEIRKAFELNKAMLGIYIHKLKDKNGLTSTIGRNPFADFNLPSGESLSSKVKCFNSQFSSSIDVYDDIQNNIGELIEYAIANKPR